MFAALADSLLCLGNPQRAHVLVIDSKPTSRHQTTLLLQECSYEVTSVKTVKDGLSVIEQHTDAFGECSINLILKEHEPPAVSACRLLMQLQTRGLLLKIPVVVVSEEYDSESVAQCLQLGAADFLLKPLRHEELRSLWTRIRFRWAVVRQAATRSRLNGCPERPNHSRPEYGSASMSTGMSGGLCQLDSNGLETSAMVAAGFRPDALHDGIRAPAIVAPLPVAAAVPTIKATSALELSDKRSPFEQGTACGQGDAAEHGIATSNAMRRSSGLTGANAAAARSEHSLGFRPYCSKASSAASGDATLASARNNKRASDGDTPINAHAKRMRRCNDAAETSDHDCAQNGTAKTKDVLRFDALKEGSGDHPSSGNTNNLSSGMDSAGSCRVLGSCSSAFTALPPRCADMLMQHGDCNGAQPQLAPCDGMSMMQPMFCGPSWNGGLHASNMPHARAAYLDRSIAALRQSDFPGMCIGGGAMPAAMMQGGACNAGMPPMHHANMPPSWFGFPPSMPPNFANNGFSNWLPPHPSTYPWLNPASGFGVPMDDHTPSFCPPFMHPSMQAGGSMENPLQMPWRPFMQRAHAPCMQPCDGAAAAMPRALRTDGSCELQRCGSAQGEVGGDAAALCGDGTGKDVVDEVPEVPVLDSIANDDLERGLHAAVPVACAVAAND